MTTVTMTMTTMTMMMTALTMVVFVVVVMINGHISTSRDLFKDHAYVDYNFSIDRIVKHI
jgi:hypothetical protein